MSPRCADCPFPALAAIDSRKARPASMRPAAAFSKGPSPAPGMADVPEPVSLGATARGGVAMVSAANGFPVFLDRRGISRPAIWALSSSRVDSPLCSEKGSEIARFSFWLVLFLFSRDNIVLTASGLAGSGRGDRDIVFRQKLP